MKSRVFDNRYKNIIVLLFAFALCSLGIWFLFKHPNPLQWDQDFIKYKLSWEGYPTMDAGVVSFWIVGIYNRLVHISQFELDSQIRSIALLLYVLTNLLLARKLIKLEYLQMIFLIILFLSRFPVLWLSSELFAGGFLSLALYFLIDGKRPVATGIAVAIAGAGKGDLLPVSGLLFLCGLVDTYRANRKQVILLCFSFVLGVFLVHGIGIYRHGLASYFANRSWMSLAQHYSHLISHHQLIRPVPEPWENWQIYINTNFPNANTFFEYVTLHTRMYMDYVGLTLAEMCYRSYLTFGWLLLFFPIRVYLLKFERLTNFEKLTLITFVGLLPMIFISALHVRYMARYFPLVVITMLLIFEKMMQSDGVRSLRKTTLFGQLVIILLLGLYGVDHFKEIRADQRDLKNKRLYWFPD